MGICRGGRYSGRADRNGEGVGMSSKPQRNEDRFYRYPTHRVAAVVDDDAQLDAALAALAAEGLDVAGVNVLSGADGVRLLDRAGARHGPRSRLVRLLQHGAAEMEVLKDHERALKEGHRVVYVPARNPDEADRIARIVREAGGYYPLYFRRWSVERPSV
jgi:hypothetical protein